VPVLDTRAAFRANVVGRGVLNVDIGVRRRQVRVASVSARRS
jgi:hypothetical protein